MKTSIEAKQAFKAWAEKNGYRAVRTITVASKPGECSLKCRAGKYTVEVSVALIEEQREVRAANAASGAADIGYRYPLVNANEKALLAFLSR